MPNMPTQPNRPNMPIMPKSTNSAHISLSVIDAFLRKVHAGFDTMTSVEQGIWREILTQINSATVEGLMQSSATSHSEAFLSALRHSNEVFAAFKVHALQQEVAAKLLTPDGRLKSFAEFRRDVEGITSHQCGAWLQTEYDTAVIRAHNAADWQGFEANKAIMPNLRWLPTTAPDPEVHHRSYWVARLNLPVDDPFWQHHHPGDHWNCKCALEQNNDPVVRPSGITTKPNEPTKPNRPNMPIEPKVVAPQPGLDNNPGKDGHTFSDNHPYFPKSCNKCPFNKGAKNRLATVFKNQKKHCYECKKINDIISDTTQTPDLGKAQGQAKVFISEYKKQIDPHNGVMIKGKEFATGSLTLLRRSLNDVFEHNREDIKLMKWLSNFNASKISGWKYKGWAENRPYGPSHPKYNPQQPDNKKHKEAEYFTYYSLEIEGDTYWANVKVHKNYGKEILYTIENKKPKDLIPGKHP